MIPPVHVVVNRILAVLVKVGPAPDEERTLKLIGWRDGVNGRRECWE